jgi:hypothetical protein
MKKLLFLLLVLSGAAYSQNVTQKKEIVTQLLCKTWVGDHALMGNLPVKDAANIKSLQYTFKANHTYLLKQVVGNWEYNEKKKCVELYLNKELKSVITKLDSKSAVMTLNASKSTPKGSPKFEIYFKPKG